MRITVISIPINRDDNYPKPQIDGYDSSDSEFFSGDSSELPNRQNAANTEHSDVTSHQHPAQHEATTAINENNEQANVQITHFHREYYPEKRPKCCTIF